MDEKVDVGYDDDGELLSCEELTEEQSANRCEECVHRLCNNGGRGGSPWGPGVYCDDPFTDLR